MVKIIYGVNGEGLGHATRSKPIIEGLLKRHEVKIVAGRRAYEYLSKKFEVKKIFAFDIIYRKNGVEIIQTIIKNILLFPIFGLATIIRLIFIFQRFKPDLVISDFEPFTMWTANLLRLPIISIDNQHISTNCRIKIGKKVSFDYTLLKIIIISFAGFADYCLVTTFFYPKIVKERTYLFPPIVRKEILELRPKTGRHILVYQTSRSYTTLIPVLKQLKNEEFRIYKTDKVGREDNVIFREFSEREFIKDLATCKAIITNGGFSLISEAIYLDKPILSVPVKRQFEQVINGMHVSQAGFGEHHEDITKGILENFIKKLPKYREELSKYHGVGNEGVVGKIEDIIKEIIKKKAR